MDMMSLLQNAQKMQESMRKAYDEMAQNNKNIFVTGKAGGNLVVVQMNLLLQITKLDLDPKLFEETQAVIAELIASATNQAIALAQERVKKEMLEITKKLGLPPGMLPNV
jgi:DNA-binding YbaB/EbfC family protein